MDALVSLDHAEPNVAFEPQRLPPPRAIRVRAGAERAREADPARLQDEILQLGGPEIGACLSSLSTMQLLVLQLLARGLLNKQIAHLCGISVATTKTHISHVIRKMNARCRTEAAVHYALYLQRHQA